MTDKSSLHWNTKTRQLPAGDLKRLCSLLYSKGTCYFHSKQFPLEGFSTFILETRCIVSFHITECCWSMTTCYLYISVNHLFLVIKARTNAFKPVNSTKRIWTQWLFVSNQQITSLPLCLWRNFVEAIICRRTHKNLQNETREETTWGFTRRMDKFSSKQKPKTRQ